MAKKQTAAAKQNNKETAEAGDSRVPAKRSRAKSKGVKLRITGGVAWLGWPYRVGQEVIVEDEKQAQEAVDAGRAEKVS